MKLSFYGADQCVTGSCHCLEVNGRRILVDCGLQQGRDEVSNDAFPFAANDIDFVLVTHAHIDHTGRIPMLVKQGFQGRIVATRLTADLMDIMLQDSAHIQESDAEWKNRKAERSGAPRVEPLYTIEDAQRVSQYMTTCEYNQPLDLCEGVRVEFVDAGHLLGSASILVTATEGGITKQIVFSGDIGNVDQPIIRDPTYLTGADYVVMESTYGDRNHTEVWSYTDDLAKIIDETIAIEAVIENGVDCGPRAYLRPGTHMLDGSKAGTHVEIKKSTIGEGSKVPHLSYIGDTTMGSGVNVGAGSITCNYDGVHKHKTVIGKDAFIGSDTMMVAPAQIGDGALVAAGSVITEPVPADALGLGRARQVNIEGWAADYRRRLHEDDEV